MSLVFSVERSSLDKTIITSINTLQIGTVDDYDYVIHSKVVYEAAAATEDDCWDD